MRFVHTLTVALLSSTAIFIAPAHSDDMLVNALKRVSELEAKNIALELNHRRLEEDYKALEERNRQLEKNNKAKETVIKKQEIKTVQKVASNTTKLNAPSPQVVTSQKPDMEEISKIAFEGAYVGINGGYGGGDFNFTQIGTLGSAFIGGQDTYYRGGGALAGGQIGYNYLSDDHYFVGGEFDFDWAAIRSSLTNSSNYASPSPTFLSNLLFNSTENYGINWVSTARTRIGYEIRGIIPYVTGGMSLGDGFHQTNAHQSQIYGSNTSRNFNINTQKGFGSAVKIGWVVGAGLEIPIYKNLSVKTEYLYTQFCGPHFNSGALTFSNYSISQDIAYGNSSAIGIHQVRFGLNYHPHFLNQPATAIVAKY